MRGWIIIQGFYNFSHSYSRRNLWPKKGSLYSNSLSLEKGKSYNFCMMPSKMSRKMYDCHNSFWRKKWASLCGGRHGVRWCDSFEMSSTFIIQVRYGMHSYKDCKHDVLTCWIRSPKKRCEHSKHDLMGFHSAVQYTYNNSNNMLR